MNDLNKLLGKAIKIATIAHEDKYCKKEKPYILHPLHLMFQLLFDVELAIIAVLHDVVEGSHFTLKGLQRKGFNKRIINAVDLLTHNDEDTYEEYIDKMRDNYDAIRVKRKDLEHNSNITRLKGLSSKDLDRIKKYYKAFTTLGNYAKKFE
jgi:(p)ppGpp synthase/HD superfamily hydrolase